MNLPKCSVWFVAALSVTACSASAQEDAPPPEELRIDVDCTDASMAEVMQDIARRAGVTIVVDEAIDARVTERFRDISWRLAVELIAKTYHCELHERDGALHLRRPTPAANALGKQIAAGLTSARSLGSTADLEARALARRRAGARASASKITVPTWRLAVFPAEDQDACRFADCEVLEVGDVVCVATSRKVAGVSAATGEVLWILELEDAYSPPSLVRRGGELLLPLDRGREAELVRLDPRSGAETGSLVLQGRYSAPDLCSTPSGLVAYDRLGFGKIDLEAGRADLFELDPGDGKVVVGPAHVAVIRYQDLSVYRLRDGEHLWTWKRGSPDSLDGLCPRPLLTQDAIVTGCWERGAWWIVELDLESGALRAHARASDAAADEVRAIHAAGDGLLVEHQRGNALFVQRVDLAGEGAGWTRKSTGWRADVFGAEVCSVDELNGVVEVFAADDGTERCWVPLRRTRQLTRQPQVTERAVYVMPMDGVLTRYMRAPAGDW